jgi:hypothetical protein
MREDLVITPGLEGRFVTFVSSAAACLAEVDEGNDILLACVSEQELERERALVGLGIVGPKNKAAELVSLFIGARTGASVCISCA